MSDKRPQLSRDSCSLDSPLDITEHSGPLFITGTDTEVGKTYVAAWLLRRLRSGGRRIGAYKPVASGCRSQSNGALVSDDALVLWHSAGEPAELDRVCPQRFAPPLAPPRAAAESGSAVDRQQMIDGARWWMDRFETVLIEGAGGLMSPLASDYLNADLATELEVPLLVVAPNRLGTINHTLLTLTAARSYGLRVLGVILNQITAESDRSAASNAEEIERYGNVRVLASLPYGG